MGDIITLEVERKKKNLDSLVEFFSSNQNVNSLLVAEITNGHASVISKLEQVTSAINYLGDKFGGVNLTGLLIFNLREEDDLKSSIYDNLARLDNVQKEFNCRLYITLVKEYELDSFKNALLSLEDEEKEKFNYLKNTKGHFRGRNRGKFITPFSLYILSKLLYENIDNDNLINELVERSSKVEIQSLLNRDKNTICTLRVGDSTQPYENLQLFKFVFMQNIPKEHKTKIQFGNLINEFKGRIAEVYNQITFLELADDHNEDETPVYFGLNNLYQVPLGRGTVKKREIDMIMASSDTFIKKIVHLFNKFETLLYSPENDYF